MFFSLKKYNFSFTKEGTIKVVKRTILIYLVGIGISWFSIFCYNVLNFNSTNSFYDRFMQGINPFERIRLVGVLARLAISYGIGSLIILCCKQKYILHIAGGILLFYSIILLLGNGFVLQSDNIINIVDRAILSINHMYRGEHCLDDLNIPFDPEGLLSTLPCIAHVLIGFYIGKIINNIKDNRSKIEQIFVLGTILLFMGYLLCFLIPINKKIWSTTFVLITCGAGALLLALLIFIIDIKGYKKWGIFFESFGVNPLFMFVVGDIFAIVFSATKFSINNQTYSIHKIIYQDMLTSWLPEYWASLFYAILFVLLVWISGYWLYKRKIYIKL